MDIAHKERDVIEIGEVGHEADGRVGERRVDDESSRYDAHAEVAIFAGVADFDERVKELLVCRRVEELIAPPAHVLLDIEPERFVLDRGERFARHRFLEHVVEERRTVRARARLGRDQNGE